MNGGAESALSLTGQTFKVFVAGGLEPAAACGVWAAGAALGAVPGAAAAAAAALVAASGWECSAAEGAPAPPSHSPQGEPASVPPRLQRQKDPAVRHVLEG